MFFGAAILVVVALACGVTVFRIMQHQGEKVLAKSLELALQSRAHLFGDAIRGAIQSAATIVTRPFLIQEIKKANRDSQNSNALSALKRGMKSFLPTGFSALALYGSNDRQLAGAGRFVTRPSIALPLAHYSHATLLWDNGLVLRLRMNVEDHGVKIGFLRADATLSGLTPLLLDLTALGRTGELALCGPNGVDMKCLPTTLHPVPVPQLARTVNGQRLPMAYALAGKTGVRVGKDYRGREVVAAYMPLAKTGLGMVLKLDSNELFAPVWWQLVYVVPSLGALVLAGVLLLRGLVAPLVRTVVTSETQTRLMNAQLRDSETRLRTLVQSIDEGIVVITAEGTIEAFNPAAERIFGYTADQVIGRNVSMLMPEPMRSDHNRHIQRYLNTGESRVIGAGREVTGLRSNGDTVSLELRITEMCTQDRRMFVGTVHDITERKRSDERILYLATHDALTDLPNRNLFLDRARQALLHAERNGGAAAILFFDLDGFKQVNDTYGHEMGDRLLKAVARRVRSVLRKDDTVARQGGDEFIIVLPEIADAECATIVARKLLDGVLAPFSINGHEIDIGISIGISLYPEHAADVEALLQQADTAMYTAKSAGGRRFHIYDRE